MEKEPLWFSGANTFVYTPMPAQKSPKMSRKTVTSIIKIFYCSLGQVKFSVFNSSNTYGHHQTLYIYICDIKHALCINEVHVYFSNFKF